jgi:hypothetical protein
MTHYGTNSEPRELCPTCGGHGMVKRGTTARFFTPLPLDRSGVWLGAALLFTAFALGVAVGLVW